MVSYVKREWTIENVWQCSSCRTDNKGRDKKCSNCGSPKDDSDVERMPKDTSPSKAVTDSDLLRKFRAGPDWVCSYCGHHETKLAEKCSECGAKQGEKRSDVGEARRQHEAEMKKLADEAEKIFDTLTPMLKSIQARQDAGDSGLLNGDVVFDGKNVHVHSEGEDDTSSPATTPVDVGTGYRQAHIDVPKEVSTRSIIPLWMRHAPSVVYERAVRHARVIAIVFLTVLAITGTSWGLYYLFATRNANATISSTSWLYHVNLRERRIYHGSDWRDSMHAHAYNVSCVREIRSYHNCDPYNCNPHSVGYDCRCTTTESCRPSCSSNRNGSSTCREICDPRTSCSTCYRTEYDTCWHRCPDYDDHCEYDYPSWPVIREASLGGSDHAPIRPNLMASGGRSCVYDDEDLYEQGFSQCTGDELTFDVQFDAKDDGHWSFHPRSLGDYRRFNVGNRWHVQYNHAGMFRPVERMR